MRRCEFVRLLVAAAPSAWPPVAGFMFCVVTLGSIGPGTIAQEALAPGSGFKECANGCPEMIVIPAGKFLMGSPENDPGRASSQGPQHEVTIAKAFAVSKFELTFQEWDACVAAGACPQVPDHWGRGRMPVINVSSTRSNM
jgi:hypothetical protein